MRITDLEAEFIRAEDRVIPVAVVDDRRSGAETVVKPVEHLIAVPTLARAQELWLLCPGCFVKNGGARGTHCIRVGFEGRGLLPHQSSQRRREPGDSSEAPRPSRWTVSGTGLDDLTLRPSVDCGCWHGFITNGEASL